MILVLFKSLFNYLSDSTSLNNSTSINTEKVMSDILVNVNHPLILKIILPLLILILGWILKHYYDKYFSLRPRLYLKLGNPLYEQMIRRHEERYRLTWRYECELKNNSKYDAYNIDILEIKQKNSDNKIITNREELDQSFQPNNHLESKDKIDFEIKKTIYVSLDTLSRIDKDNNVLPGLKIENPEEELKPKTLNNIRLVIRYKNEKGKTLYTKFRRKGMKEKNKMMSWRPYIIKQLIQ
jgi:hypothetical protein